MSNFIYLITSDQIDWLDNYDEGKTNSVIRDVQRSFIRPIFHSYYEYLIKKVENGGVNNLDQYILDEYITPMMSLLCMNEFVRVGGLKITNVGANFESGEEFERYSSSKESAIMTANNQKVETYKTDMIDYMVKNKSLLKEFKTDYDCRYKEYEEVFNMSTIKGRDNIDSIYGANYYAGKTRG